MNVTFACSRCEASNHVAFDGSAGQIACAHCDKTTAVPDDAWQNEQLARCLLCSGTDLFVRKDFPQRLGLTIVVVGFAISCVTWYYYRTYITFGVLFATALADMLLFMIVGESLVCYRCHAEYRDIGSLAQHGTFDLETHEKYRQQQARLRQLQRRVSSDSADVVEAMPPQGASTPH